MNRKHKIALIKKRQERKLEAKAYAQNSEIIRLQSRIRELEGQVFGGSVQ